MKSRLYRGLDERLRLAPIVDVLRANASTEQQDAPSLTLIFSIGRISVVLTVMLVVSGVFMTLSYTPTPDRAFESIQHMQSAVPLGWLMRGVHRWSALLLMASVILHALRVALMRAYLYPRDLNWWLGIGLLILVFVFGATGYLLRWDIKAFTLMLLVKENLASFPVVGNLLVAFVLGGSTVDIVPLFRGYAFHIWFLPLLLALLLGAHLFIAWRQGLAHSSHDLGQRVVVLAPATRRRLRFLPGLLTVLLVLVLAGVLPVQEPITGPTDTSALPHPDWLFVFYFLPFWFFEGPWRAVGAVAIPAAIVALLAALPWLRGGDRRKLTRVALTIASVVWVAWLFTQGGRMGAHVPTQGCAACHKPGIVGGAPTRVSEFKRLGPEWLVDHLQDPPRSLVQPFTASDAR
jgi:ubiquinol-cytochrome c reductase cytochrome b subunit